MRHAFSTLMTLIALVLGSNFSNAAIIVHEAFDYTAGADIVGQTGGVGLSGAYTGFGSSGNFDAVGGLGFGNLDVSGGASGRVDRAGNGAIARTISMGAQAEIAAANEIWFSALIDPTDSTLTPDVAGFPTNFYATFAIGNGNFINGSGVAVPTFNGSTGFGFGLADTVLNGADITGTQIQGVAFDTGLTQGARVVTGDVVSFIVGQVDFAADTVTLWNVTDANLALPATTLASFTIDGGIDGSDLTTISIGDAQTAIFDEIRIGTTLASVTPRSVPEPASLGLCLIAGLGFIGRRKRNA